MKTRSSKRPGFAALAGGTLLVVAGVPLRAAETLSWDFFQPRIALSGARIAGESAAPESLRGGSVALEALTPLGNTRRFGKATVGQFFLRARYEDFRPETQALAKAPHFLEGNLSLGAFFIQGDRFRYFALLGTRLAEDTDTVRRPSLGIFALAGGTYKAADPLDLIYGAALFTGAGRTFAFPLLGASYRFAPGWSLRAVLPSSLQVQREIPQGRWGVLLGSAQEAYRMANNSRFPGKDEILSWQARQRKAGFFGEIRVFEPWTVSGELGIMGRRTLTVRAGDIELLSQPLDSELYVNINLALALGKNAIERRD